MKEYKIPIDQLREIIIADITPEIIETLKNVDFKIIQQARGKFIDKFKQSIMDNPGFDNQWHWHNLFANWHGNLPNKYYGESISRYRDANEQLGYLDRPNFETKKGMIETPSALFMMQTPREFSATICTALFITENLSLEKVLQMNSNLTRTEHYAELNKYTLPGFIKLLALGYTFNDLIQ